MNSHILPYLDKYSITQIAKLLERATIYYHLNKLLKSNHIERVGRGKYRPLVVEGQLALF